MIFISNNDPIHSILKVQKCVEFTVVSTVISAAHFVCGDGLDELPTKASSCSLEKTIPPRRVAEQGPVGGGALLVSY